MNCISDVHASDFSTALTELNRGGGRRESLSDSGLHIASRRVNSLDPKAQRPHAPPLHCFKRFSFAQGGDYIHELGDDDDDDDDEEGGKMDDDRRWADTRAVGESKFVECLTDAGGIQDPPLMSRCFAPVGFPGLSPGL